MKAGTITHNAKDANLPSSQIVRFVCIGGLQTGWKVCRSLEGGVMEEAHQWWSRNVYI